MPSNNFPVIELDYRTQSDDTIFRSLPRIMPKKSRNKALTKQAFATSVGDDFL